MDRFNKLFVGVVLAVGLLCVGFATTGTADNNTVFLLSTQGGVVFDAPWDYVKAGYSPELNLNDITVECWVNPVAIDPRTGLPPGRMELVGRSWSVPYALWRWETGTVNFMVFFPSVGGIQPKQITSTSVVPPGVWTHVAGTYSSSTGELKIYVNGVLEGTNNISTHTDITSLVPFVEVTDLTIGTTAWDYPFLNIFFGLMDEIRISNVARDPSEFLTRDGEYAQGYDNGYDDGYADGLAVNNAALLDMLPPGIRKNVEKQQGFAK